MRQVPAIYCFRIMMLARCGGERRWGAGVEVLTPAWGPQIRFTSRPPGVEGVPTALHLWHNV